MSEQRDGQRDYGDECGCGCQDRPMIGLLAQLTPEQRGAALAFDGSENFGPPDTEFRLRPAVQPEERGKGS